MDIRIIINSILIIFILHIIILNINYSYTYGKKNNNENFKNSTEYSKDLDFLKNDINNDDTENDNFKKKLLKYIQEDEIVKENKFESKNIIDIKASNTYLNSNNVPNFESNVADTSKFYINNYDNLNEDQLKATSIEDLNKLKDKNIVTVDVQSNSPCNIKTYGRESTATPDNWNYKDELPMNGGTMNGIVGFDNLESQFAIYNPNKLNLQSVNNDKFNNIPHDDLRKPIIYEN
jgi:hypothetical protein